MYFEVRSNFLTCRAVLTPFTILVYFLIGAEFFTCFLRASGQWENKKRAGFHRSLNS